MVTLNYIKINNFMILKDIDLKFEDGIHFLRGEVENCSYSNSNHAGKSSIVEALCWCLGNFTIRSIRGDDVINDYADRCRVEIGANVDGNDCIIVRTKEEKKGSVVKVNDMAPEESEEFLQHVFGDSNNILCTLVFAQDAMDHLHSMTGNQRKALIEGRIPHFLRLADGKESLEVKLSILQREMSEVDAKRVKIQDKVSSEAAHLLSLSVQLSALKLDLEGKEERLATERRILKGRKKIAEDYISGEDRWLEVSGYEKWNDKFTLLIERNDKLEEAQTEVEKKVKDLTWKRNNIDTQMSKMENLVPCFECGDGSNPKVIKLPQMELSDLSKLQNQIDDLNKQLGQLNMELDKVKREKNVADSFLHNIDDQIGTLIGDCNVEINGIEYKLKDKSNGIDTSSLVPLETLIKNSEESIKVFNKEIQHLSDLYNNYVDTNEHYSWWLREGIEAIRYSLYELLSPSLNKYLSDIILEMMDDSVRINFVTQKKLKTGELRDKFEIEVDNDGVSRNGNSRGEIEREDFCVMLAVRKAMASMRGTTNLLFIDEPCAYLDRIGIERLLNVLKKETPNIGCVIVTSQLEQIESSIDDVITVTRRKDGSYLT